MPNQPPKSRAATPPPPPLPADTSASGPERPAAANAGPTATNDERGITDFMRRAVSAGFEVASRSKDDVLRVATGEIRAWLDRLDLDKELMKALAKMTVEVKAEIRFRPNAEGQIVPTATTSDVTIKSSDADPAKET